MTLIGIRLSGPQGEFIYVNPDYIVEIRPQGKGSHLVLSDGRGLNVVGAPREIADTVWENEREARFEPAAAI